MATVLYYNLLYVKRDLAGGRAVVGGRSVVVNFA